VKLSTRPSSRRTGKIHHQRAPGLEQAGAHLRLDLQQVGGARELVDGHPVQLRPPFRPRGHQVGLGLEDVFPAARPTPFGVH
jgi:hypothetical protein